MRMVGRSTTLGTLAVNFGYTPAVGAIFDLFSNVGSFTGNFATITSNLGGSSYSFDPGSGNLTVLAVPEPAMLSMLGVSAMLMLRRRRVADLTRVASKFLPRPVLRERAGVREIWFVGSRPKFAITLTPTRSRSTGRGGQQISY